MTDDDCPELRCSQHPRSCGSCYACRLVKRSRRRGQLQLLASILSAGLLLATLYLVVRHLQLQAVPNHIDNCQLECQQ